jgi:hypothetical protein
MRPALALVGSAAIGVALPAYLGAPHCTPLGAACFALAGSVGAVTLLAVGVLVGERLHGGGTQPDPADDDAWHVDLAPEETHGD